MNISLLLIFIIFTIFFGIFTWQFSVKAKRPHGIPRFFAFESILLLMLQNYIFWFMNPFAWYQIISWILLASSIFFAVSGFILLYKIGKPKDDFENTTKLVVSGMYKYIRHPLYASLLFLGTGIFFKVITPITTVLALINLISVILTAKFEEKEMLLKFGNEYANYLNNTKMFIPFIL